MKKDIFDRIMEWRLLRPFNPLYKRYKEPLLYLFFGGLTTVVNIVCFWLVAKVMPPLAANVVAWIVSVLFAYWTNSTWVFESQNTIGEFAKFVGGRVGTLGLEEAILFLGIEVLGMQAMPVKILGQVGVVIGNYVISKWLVFKPGK